MRGRPSNSSDRPYIYALSNPMTYLDPFGRESEVAGGATTPSTQQEPCCCCCPKDLYFGTADAKNKKPADWNKGGGSSVFGHELRVGAELEWTTSEKFDPCKLEWYELTQGFASAGFDADTWVNQFTEQTGKNLEHDKGHGVFGDWYRKLGVVKCEKDKKTPMSIALGPDHPRIAPSGKKDGKYYRYFIIRITGGATCKCDPPSKIIYATQLLPLAEEKEAKDGRDFKVGELSDDMKKSANKSIKPPPFPDVK